MGILAITYAYLADCLKERSPEGVAAATATRYMICAAASGFVLPMNNAITAAGANGDF